MKKITLITFIILGFCFVVDAQSDSEKDKQLSHKLDSALIKQFKPNEPGCAVLVSKKGQILYKKAFGMANLELNVPMSSDMVFAIASITKQFTGIAIMQLVEKNKINLQDSISKYIPDYPTHGYYISIEHLLTHTSGIKNFMALEDFDSIVKRIEYNNPMDFINLFKKENMDFAPGTKWNYSNSGYFLLGYIIEQVSGITYQQYIEENIFKPAGMTNSYYNDYKEIIKNRVTGYGKDDNGFTNPLNLNSTVAYSAGSLLSTVEDMFNYYQALNSYKLVSKESLEKTRTRYKLSDGKETDYGYGVQVANWGVPVIYHLGGGSGFTTFQVYYPEKDLNFILFTNCKSYFDDINNFALLSLFTLDNCE
jgi:CubicO group peptidase (beta-lactamase class C family)